MNNDLPPTALRRSLDMPLREWIEYYQGQCRNETGALPRCPNLEERVRSLGDPGDHMPMAVTKMMSGVTVRCFQTNP